MDANWSAIARTALVGILVPLVIGLVGGTAAAETATGAQMAATPPAERPLALDPEKDTVALEPRQGVSISNGPTARRDDASLTSPVRVGQGLRSDGTELVPSEVSRPWLIRQ